MNELKKSLILCLAVALIPACGTSDIDFKNYGQHIINGEDDTSVAHQAVVLVDLDDALCTGTLITPRVVLTAGHCLDGRDVNKVKVGFGNNSASVEWRKAEEIMVHPRFFLGNWFVPLTNDIALLRMDNDAPAGITPIPFMPHAMTVTEADIGSPIEFVGFGLTETNSSGDKLTITMTLEYVCSGSSICDFGGDIKAAANTIGHDQASGGTCLGDSGGPGFMLRNGKEYVAGITSYGDQACASDAFDTKVDEFEEFINDFIGVNGELGNPCSSNSQCESGHCASGVCCTEACDNACMACNLQGSVGSCLALTEGSSCADGNLCNGDETCQAGQCIAGTPLDCKNDDPCTDEACVPSSGCQYNPMPDGTACDSSNQCLAGGICQTGVCQDGAPISCDDHNACTQDSCLPDAGCVFHALPNGSACGSGLCGQGTCSEGECQLAQITCDDHNPCTENRCDPQIGCVYHAVSDELNLQCGDCLVCKSAQCVADENCEPDPVTCASSGAHPASGLSFGLLLLGLFLRRRRP